MDGRAFIQGLYGNAQRAALELPEPRPATRVMVTAAEMGRPGWLGRLLEQNGASGALQVITATGEAVAFIEDPVAAMAVAGAQEIAPPEVIDPTAQLDLFA